MKWGEIYRTRERIAERGDKPGFYVVVSRDFIAGHDDVTTVVSRRCMAKCSGFEPRCPSDPMTGCPVTVPSGATS